jgi:hypothetical protein
LAQDFDGSGCGFAEILSQNFLGGTEENYVNPQSGYWVFRTKPFKDISKEHVACIFRVEK